MCPVHTLSLLCHPVMPAHRALSVLTASWCPWVHSEWGTGYVGGLMCSPRGAQRRPGAACLRPKKEPPAHTGHPAASGPAYAWSLATSVLEGQQAPPPTSLAGIRLGSAEGVWHAPAQMSATSFWWPGACLHPGWNLTEARLPAGSMWAAEQSLYCRSPVPLCPGLLGTLGQWELNPVPAPPRVLSAPPRVLTAASACSVVPPSGLGFEAGSFHTVRSDQEQLLWRHDCLPGLHSRMAGTVEAGVSVRGRDHLGWIQCV